MRFESRQRLRRQADFLAVRKKGRTYRCSHFFVQMLETPVREDGLQRIGIITSRRVGNAVKRNRARRLFREIFRHNQKTLPKSCDIVVVVRYTFDSASYGELQQQLLKGVAHLVQKSTGANR